MSTRLPSSRRGGATRKAGSTSTRVLQLPVAIRPKNDLYLIGQDGAGPADLFITTDGFVQDEGTDPSFVSLENITYLP